MTINQQIRCVSREVVMREKMYPKWVEEGRMKSLEASHEIECMKSVLKLLNEIADKNQGKFNL